MKLRGLDIKEDGVVEVGTEEDDGGGGGEEENEENGDK